MTPDEGALTFWLRHEHVDWATNNNGYEFGEVAAENFVATAVKHPDKTVEFKLSGPFGAQFNFRVPIPKCDDRGLFVAFTWKRPDLALYLNGVRVENRSV